MSATLLALPLTVKQVRYAAIAFTVLATLALLFHINHTPDRSKPVAYAGTRGTKVSAARQASLQPIHNTTLGFEAILAINLPERSDHRDALVLASAISGLHVDFVDGVHGDQVLDKVLPYKHATDISSSVKGSWRAHINALRRVVENDWSTALILEDDVDWDIRLKAQLQDVALASDYVLRSDNSHDGGFVPMADVNSHSSPRTSPYGDDWDVLWLGHCGMDVPDKPESTVVLLSDETVPEPQYQKSWDKNAKPPMSRFQKHTRAIMAPTQGTCTLAYAVSQRGARQLLLAFGIQRLDYAFDLMLRDWCQGSNGHEKHACVGVLPQLFDHHRRAGPSAADSDISAPNHDIREKAYTLNIRWSVQMNMARLLRGDTDYEDQYPDTM